MLRNDRARAAIDQLESHERAAIDAFAARLAAAGWSRLEFGLEYFIENWIGFSLSARRYSMTIYDYTNDLDTRSILRGAIERADPIAGAALERLLRPFDERFREGTREVPGFWRGGSGEWWNDRVPLEPGDEMATDLRDWAP